MTKTYVNLHAHSFYSILKASPSPKKILAHAQSLGHKYTALTDTNVTHGLINFVEQVKKINGDITPILGAEIAVAKDSRFERRAGIDGREGHIVLLAQNQTGWENLLAIMSTAALQGLYHQPRTDWEFLAEHNEGLICLTGSKNSLITKALKNGGEPEANKIITKLKNIFEDRLYLEIVSRPDSIVQETNTFIVTNHQQTNIPLVVTCDAHFLSPEDEEANEVLSCIGNNEILDQPGRPMHAEGAWFKSWREIEAELDYIPAELLEQARINTLKVAESMDLNIEFGRSLLPEFEVDKDKNVPQQLRHNCESQIPILYKEDLAANPGFMKEIQERLDYELSIIGKMGFEAYFLIVQDFIDYARDQNIMVGPGRGSAAGSIVSYLLSITTIDPLKYELLFERFLNPERISMPDIDIDFSDERREEVMHYVVDKYGDEKVSKVCTFGTLSAKAALKDVGRALGVPFNEMNALTKLLPGTPGFKLKDAKEVKDFQAKVDSDHRLQKVFGIAEALEGCVRHVSVHACAVIIGPSDLKKFAPIQWAPGAEEVKITQVPYQQLEHIGLLKMDFLGLKNLSILEKTLKNIKQTTGKEIELATIPLDDVKTFEMMSRGETTGVFQFESDGMRRYLRELKPTELEDLVAMNALYRPGPMEYIPDYIRGKHDPKTVKYIDPVLEPLLKKTYGIAVYQEQVLKIAQVFSGFSLGQADILRKAIGKKIIHILEEQRQKFIDGAVANGHKQKMAEKIFDDIIVPFSGYGFNRSHAVCYARIAYETAYLRANYPVEFMAAMMTTDRNNTDRIVLEMNECHTMEIEVLPPSVNESGSYFSIVEEAKKIRFGLTAIKGLGEDTVDMIIEEREKSGTFTNLQNFAERAPLKVMNKKSLEALTFSGAFDQFAARGDIIASLDDLAKFAKEFQEKESAGQIGLFGAQAETVSFKLKKSNKNKKEILNLERETLGLFVSDHPLKGMDEYFSRFGKLISELGEKWIKKTVVIHGIVTRVKKIYTKAGKSMAILEIEDTSSKIEVAIFPRAYEKIDPKSCETDMFLEISGQAQERDGKINFIAETVKIGQLEQIQCVHNEEYANEKNEEEAILTTPKTQNTNIPYQIVFPSDTNKEQLTEIKNLIRRNKVGHGKIVIMTLNGHQKKVPFQVHVDEEFKQKIEKILRPDQDEIKLELNKEGEFEF
jgi:DNA polymerase-3 subunit alpha